MRHLSMASQLAANVSYERKSGASQYLIAIASWLSNGFEDYAYCFYPKGFIYGLFEDEKLIIASQNLISMKYMGFWGFGVLGFWV